MSDAAAPARDPKGPPARETSERPAVQVHAREFTPADRARVLEIFETVYDAQVRANFDTLLDWQYLDNPYRPAGVPCSMVVEEDGAVVGFLGFYYNPTQVGSAVFPSAWVIGFVTHPDARGSAGPRFIREASRTIDPVPVLLGNPGTHIMRFWSWFRAGVCTTAPIMIRPVDLSFLAREKLPPPLGAVVGSVTWGALGLVGGIVDGWASSRARRRGVRIETVAHFDASLDGLWRRARRRHPNMTARDRAYLEWRYVRCPLGGYALRVARLGDETVGYAVFRVFDAKRMRKGVLVDLLVEDDDPVVARALVASGMRHFRGEGVHLAYTIAPCQHLFPVLESMGFVARWDDAGGTRFVMGRVNVEGTAEQAAFFDDRRWYVSFGDADYDLVVHLL